MKKHYLFGVGLLCMTAFPAWSQNTWVTATATPSSIQEIWSASPGSGQQVPVTLNLTPGAAAPDTLYYSVTITPGSGSAVQQMGSVRGIIPVTDVGTGGYAVPVQVFVPSDTVQEADEWFSLTITLSDSGDMRSPQVMNVPLRVKDARPAVDPSNPFSIAIGSNFDFVEGIQPNSVYARVEFFKPEVLKLSAWRKERYLAERAPNVKARMQGVKLRYRSPSGKALSNDAVITDDYLIDRLQSRLSRFGLQAGLVQNQFISNLDSNPALTRNVLVQAIGTTGGIYRTDTVTQYQKGTINALGFYLSPMYRITYGHGDQFGSLFLLGDIQGLRQTYTEDISFAVKRGLVLSDTLPLGQEQPYSPSSRQVGFHDYYIGVGCNFLYQSRYGDLLLKVVPAGYHWRNDLGDINIPNLGFTPSGAPDFTRMYYLFQFNITENKVGINFGGEIRGDYGRDNVDFISLHLAKVFDLSRFLSYK